MKTKLLSLLFVIFGVLMIVGAFVAEIAWLGFCFGTVVIGVLMLLMAPGLFFAPFIFLFGTGATLWGSGVLMIRED